MIEALALSILSGLGTLWLINNPVYLSLIKKLNLNRKPFNCTYCLPFYVGFITAVLTNNNLPLVQLIPLVLITAAASSMVAVVVERFYESMPQKIK